jgi:hypothetical protein
MSASPGGVVPLAALTHDPGAPLPWGGRGCWCAPGLTPLGPGEGELAVVVGCWGGPGGLLRCP